MTRPREWYRGPGYPCSMWQGSVWQARDRWVQELFWSWWEDDDEQRTDTRAI